MIPVGELIPSFHARQDDTWSGAIWTQTEYGPVLILECKHRHRLMRHAVLCAQSELDWAHRVVELADELRDVAS